MKNFVIAILFVFVILGFAGGFYVGQIAGYVPPVKGAANLDVGQPVGSDFSLFWDAWRVIQEEYAGAESLDFHAMVQGAIKGMVGSLGDPYTTFMSADDTKIFLDDIAGSFSGIGIEIGVRDEKLQVIAPLEGAPAEKAGLRAGDHIVRINEDTFTSDLSIDEAVTLIRGPEGTTVLLSIMREGWEKPRDFTIERAVINIPSLKLEFKENRIAYLKIFQFSEQLKSDFEDIEGQLFKSSDKIIIDLRNNPGGFLHIAVDIAGWFLERGDVVVIEDFGAGQEQEVHKARGSGHLSGKKVVVLINGGTASASEILAGALRDNRGILLIGEKSFGKGSVQELKELKDESSLKITVAKWLTPKGNLIAELGLEPDVKVEMTDEDFDAKRDPQLDKAIEVLKNL
ncbi:MAG TPA: S41 family peptidase [Candidatus Paceibacterota bacterium]